MGSLERMLESNRYSELRRRIIRRVMHPLLRASDARLAEAGALSASDIHRILICRPNHRLGNLLLLTPLVTEIQRLFPNADIDIVLAGEHVAELFLAFPNVRHIYNLSRRMIRHPIALVRTAARIRRTRYDLAIDPCEASQSSRFLVAIARPKHVIAAPRARLATGSMSARMERAPAHIAQWPVYMLREAVTSRTPDREYPVPDIRLSEQERQCARVRLDQLVGGDGESGVRRIIGVFVEATGAKACGKEWWQRFLGAVEARHPDAALVEIVPADGRPRLALPCFGSRSPREVAAVIANMTCFVSADCGVMHLASAAGVPTIGLFKASDARKYTPYGNASQALDINGKSPEEVAQAASALIATFHAATPAAPFDHSRTDTAATVLRTATAPDPHGH